MGRSVKRYPAQTGLPEMMGTSWYLKQMELRRLNLLLDRTDLDDSFGLGKGRRLHYGDDDPSDESEKESEPETCSLETFSVTDGVPDETTHSRPKQ